MVKDLYKILGVSRSADQEQIKKAYRRLARETHPDSDPGNPWAEDEFKELSAAYELLSDPAKRARYDNGEIDADGNKRRTGRPGPGAGAYRNTKKPFDNFFRKRAAKEGSGIKVRGANVTYTLKVDFLEAAMGITKRVSMTNGRRLDVHVPPGTEDNQTLRLKGQGMPGINDEAGDALVTILVDPHPSFRREGNDIHTEVPVSLPEAVLGGRIEVATIDGSVAVTVPAGSNTGSVLRLKGKGIGGDDAMRGDHYVKLHVVLPAKPDKELTEFIRTWQTKHAYDVRARKAKVE